MHHKCTQGWARGVIFEKLVYKNEINPKIVYLLGLWQKYGGWSSFTIGSSFIIKARLL
jgi:hypothetical protein